MPISVSANADASFQVVTFSGKLTYPELEQFYALHQSRPDLAAADAIHIVAEDIDVSELTLAQFDNLRHRHAQLYQSIDFHMLRRSVWVCGSAAAWALAEYWLRDRHSRDGRGTEVSLVASLDEATSLFTKDEVDAVAQGRSFCELARIVG